MGYRENPTTNASTETSGRHGTANRSFTLYEPLSYVCSDPKTHRQHCPCSEKTENSQEALHCLTVLPRHAWGSQPGKTLPGPFHRGWAGPGEAGRGAGATRAASGPFAASEATGSRGGGVRSQQRILARWGNPDTDGLLSFKQATMFPGLSPRFRPSPGRATMTKQMMLLTSQEPLRLYEHRDDR